MALRREDNITPEENLLRLIEKPAGLGEMPSQDDGPTILLGRKKGVSPKIIISGLLAFPAIILGLGKRISLKTVNRVCLVMITVLLGYAVWGAVSAETLVITEPEIRSPNGDGMVEPPDISQYINEVDKRDIFMDMYKPPVVEPAKTFTPISITTQPTAAEPKLTMTEVLKNLKLVGIIWDPQSVTSGLIMIDNGNDVLCLASGDILKTNVEQSGAIRNVNLEVKEISKDKVTLRYVNEEGVLTLTDK